MSLRSLWFLLLLSTLVGCPGSGSDDDDDDDSSIGDDDDATGDDDDATADDDDATGDDDDATGDDDDTGPGDDDDSSAAGGLNGTVAEGMGPLAGAQVTLVSTGDSATTSSEGYYSLPNPGGPQELLITSAGVLPYTAYIDADLQSDSSTGLLHPVWSETVLNQFGSALGTTVDLADGVISVGLVGDNASLAGTSVSIDASNDGSVGMFFGPPEVTDTFGSNGGEILFFNVVPGAVTLTATPPNGVTCSGRMDLAVSAGGVTAVRLLCD